jgi:hypothetical protein
VDLLAPPVHWETGFTHGEDSDPKCSRSQALLSTVLTLPELHTPMPPGPWHTHGTAVGRKGRGHFAFGYVSITMLLSSHKGLPGHLL